MSKSEFVTLLQSRGYSVVFDHYGTPLVVTAPDAIGETAEAIEAIVRTCDYDGSRGRTCRTEQEI